MLAGCAKTRNNLYEVPADLRDRNKNLFKAPHGDAMMLFMWQNDIIGVALGSLMRA